MKRNKQILSCLTILLALSSISSAVFAQDATSAQEIGVLLASNTAATATTTQWTRAERMAAQPYSPPALNPSDFAAAVDAAADAAASGPAGFAPGGLPNKGADLEAQQMFPEEALAPDTSFELAPEQSITTDGATTAGVAEPTGTAGVFTTYLGNFYTAFWQQYPYKATGKLFFTTATGGSAYCSASIISPNNILVTAAHCLYDTDTNQWHSNWSFCPASRNGACPYLTFPWSVARVLPAWIAAPNYNAGIRYDVGLIQLNRNVANNHVTFYTGWLARSWNFGSVQNITEIGYPSNLPTGSIYSYIGHAETFSGGTDLLKYGSNMTFGASGSPLLRLYAPYQSGAVNSVNAVQSGSFLGTDTNIAPRFSTTNIVALCNLQGC